MNSLENLADNRLKQLKEQNLYRQMNNIERTDSVYVEIDGKKLISFSCNDYLGFSNDNIIKKAAIDAIEKYGTGAGASRLVSGNHPLYSELESKLARLKSTEKALVFGSGYLTNIGVISALVGKGDLIIMDRLAHACLIDGAKLSGAKLMRFAHNSVEKCAEILKKYRKQYKSCLIITDGVFSMDGDVAPVDELFALANRHDAWLMTDDAHGVGVLNDGAGSSPSAKPHIQMGTLSKAIGSYGGYVCASAKIIDYLTNKCRSLVYSTALPPSVVAASIAAIDIINSDKERVAKPLANAQYFTELLGVENAQSSIVAIILGDEKKALSGASMLREQGFFVSAIRPPTVPTGTCRLRFTFSCLHKRKDIGILAGIIKQRLL